MQLHGLRGLLSGYKNQVDKVNYKEFSEIEFRFFNYRNNYKSLWIKEEDIDEGNMLIEKDVWKKINDD